MTAQEQLDRLHALLDAISDCELDVFWMNRDPLINCNDMFAWGCSDCEPITYEDIPALRKAFEDSEIEGAYLFIARKRGMRPQGAFYAHVSKETWPLLDACGPHRPSDFGNPVATDAESIEAYMQRQKEARKTA